MIIDNQSTSDRFTAPFLLRSMRPPRLRRHVIRPSVPDGGESAADQSQPMDRGLFIQIASISRNGAGPSNPAASAAQFQYSVIKAKVTLKIYHRSSEMQQELITKSFMRWISISQQSSGSADGDLREVSIKSDRTFIPEDELALLLTDGTFDLGRQYRLSVWFEATTNKDWPFPGIDRGSESSRRFALVAYDYDLYNHGLNSQPLSLWNYSSEPTETCYSLNVDFRWPIMPVRPTMSLAGVLSPSPVPVALGQSGNLSRALPNSGFVAGPPRASAPCSRPTVSIPERRSNPGLFMPLCVSTTTNKYELHGSSDVQMKEASLEKNQTQNVYETIDISSDTEDVRETARSASNAPSEANAPEVTPHHQSALDSSSSSYSRLHSPAESPSAQLLSDSHLEPRVSLPALNSANTDGPRQRRLRARKQQAKSYNLQLLCGEQFREDTPSSDSSARSKRPRKRLGPGTGLIKYYFDHCWVQRDRFRCLPCGNMHVTLDLLLQHLQSAHKNVEFATKQPDDQAESTSIYIRPLPRLVANVAANTHIALSDPAGLASMTTVNPIELPPQEPETFTVPNNGLPIYDHVTHTELTPGTQHTHAGLDKSWLIHRHQCALNDYTDITGAEKSYILAWSTYSLAHDTTRATVARVWLSFLRDHLRWLITAQDLVHQVMHHASVLTACDVLDMDTHDAALNLVQQAWDAWATKLQTMAGNGEAPTAVARAVFKAHQEAEAYNPVAGMRSIKAPPVCALCQTNILASAWALTCAHLGCSASYHGRCVRKKGEKGLFSQSWKCERCREDKSTD